jgi:mannosyltransferase OCH1-like enzyme
MIPKIIHQTAPNNKDEWHPIWILCNESVKNNFKNFKYILWNDEDIDNFILKNFPNQYLEYKKIPFHIIKIDLFRYVLLYVHGGIYIDMDMYCYQNFFNDLNSDINLVESDCPDEFGKIEIVQNSLMAGKKNKQFFLDCFLEGIKRSKETKFNKEIHDNHYNVKYISGPILLKDIMLEYKKLENINILPLKYFNTTNNHWYNPQHKVRHMASGMWGKEIHIMFKNLKEKENNIAPLKEYHKKSYLNKTKIDIDKLDFYKKYYDNNN